MSATHEQMLKLQKLRRSLPKGLFCFEKGGKFFLYREVPEARNVLVLVRSNIDDFVRRALNSIEGS